MGSVEKVTFEQRFEENEEISHMGVWETSAQQRTASAKALR